MRIQCLRCGLMITVDQQDIAMHPRLCDKCLNSTVAVQSSGEEIEDEEVKEEITPEELGIEEEVKEEITPEELGIEEEVKKKLLLKN